MNKSIAVLENIIRKILINEEFDYSTLYGPDTAVVNSVLADKGNQDKKK